MNDFLREHLGMTGTKFGCGAAQCLSCAIIIDNQDGTSHTSPTCIVPAVHFDGLSIRTVEGHAKNGELSVLQLAFIDHFAFQCGYCTAGFLNESQVLLERLAKTPIARADVENTIAEALDGHLCRCTGYIKYHEAVRDVILSDLQNVISSSTAWMNLFSRSANAAAHRERPKMRQIPLMVVVALMMLMMGGLTVSAQTNAPAGQLAPPESFSGITDDATRSAALFIELGNNLDKPALHELSSGHGLPAAR